MVERLATPPPDTANFDHYGTVTQVITESGRTRRAISIDTWLMHR